METKNCVFRENDVVGLGMGRGCYRKGGYDNPSGIDCDNGEILGVAVKANITITFLTRKQGLFLNYGPSHSGKILFSDLNCHYDEFSKEPLIFLFNFVYFF